MDDSILPPNRDRNPVEYVIRDDVIIQDQEPLVTEVSALPHVLSTEARFSNKVEMPELRGFSMRKTMTTLRQAGLKFKLQGSGKVTWQSPKPGSIVNKGTICNVGLK